MALIETVSYGSVLAEMEKTFEEEAGFIPGEASDIGIRLRVLATQIDSIASSGKWLLKQMFFTTASGEYLDMHAAMKGITRNKGRKAAGNLRFSLASPLSYDVTIPKGTVCTTSDSDPLRFVVTKLGVLPAGSTSLVIAAEAEAEGVGGNVLPGRVSVIVSPPAVGMKVSNTSIFQGGVDSEGDETLRDRIKKVISYPSNGTNAAYYISEALKMDSVQSASVIPRDGGRGKVSVYIAGAGKTADSETVSQLADKLSKAKEINVDVRVFPATTRSVPVSMKLKEKEGTPFEEVRIRCTAIIQDYFAGLMVGEPFRRSVLGKKLLCECEELADCQFILPTENQIMAATQLGIAGAITLSEWGSYYG